jgi:parallel beta-helix repeat protein
VRYQRLGITGIAAVLAAGIAIVVTNEGCTECAAQSISATGEAAPSPSDLQVDEDGLRQALVVKDDLDQLSGPPITLADDDGEETTTTAPAKDETEDTSTGETTTTSEGETTTTADGETTTTTADGETTTTTADGETTTTTADGETTTTARAEKDTTTTAEPAENKTTATSADTAQGTSESDDSGSSPAEETTTTTAPPNTSPPVSVSSNAPANGPKVYVNPGGGNDGNDGSSPDKAKRSLQDVLRHVKPGQQVLLMNGEYRDLASAGEVHYWMKNSGQPNNWIKIGAAPGHRPVIKATRGTALLIDGDYVEVSGLTIQGSGFNTSNSWGVGIAVADSHHVNVIGNRVSGMPQTGIGIARTSNFRVLNNVVYENSFWHDSSGSGINIFHQKNYGFGPTAGPYHDLIMGNRTYRNENKVFSKWQNRPVITDGNGIIVDSNKETGYSGRTLVANNLSFDNGGRGINVWASNNVDVMFNTTYHNVRTSNIIGGGAEIGFGRGQNIRVTNNVVWARSGKPGIDYSETDGSSYSRDNVSVTDVAPKSQNDTVINYNPGLRNPSTSESGADFRPNPGSMLEGRVGSVDGMVPTDLLGTGRSGPTEPGAFIVEASQGR